MIFPEQAAKGLVDALLELRLVTAVAYGSSRCVVSVQEHPAASVHFKLDNLGELLTEFVFDGRPPVRVDYLATPAAARELARVVADTIAGEGGGALR